MEQKSQINKVFSTLLKPLTEPLYNEIRAEVKQEFEKRSAEEIATRYIPQFLNSNTGSQNKRAENSSVGYDTLRGLAQNYPVARACINYRKNQVKKLHWELLPEDEDMELDDMIEDYIEMILEKPYGANSSWRKFIDIIVQDVLALDAVSIAYERNVRGDLIGLIPVDPATIRMRLNMETGRLPEPPITAFSQFIDGKLVAEMTTDDLYYDFMNPSSYTPYGTSLIESLIITVSTALKVQSRNFKGVEAGNVPEGLASVPEGWTPDQIAEWQAMWDALVNNPMGGNRDLKWVPSGTQYIKTNTSTEAEYMQFEQWLMQVTCAVFAVPPEELGFTSTVNKATAETQKETSIDNGLKPLARFIEEMINKIIKEQMGLKGIKFTFTDLDPSDTDMELRVEAHELQYGIKSVRQAQRERGYEESGLDYIIGVPGAVTLESMMAGSQPMEQEMMQPEPQEAVDAKEVETEDLDVDKLRKADLRKWRKRALADVNRGRNYMRPFQSDYIDDVLAEEIEDKIALSDGSAGAIDKIFTPFLSEAGDLIIKLQQLGARLDRN